MEYVRKRRLIRASEDILGGRKVLDAALDWGYQSHSGFTKAFTGEFGFPPALLRGFRMQMTEIQGGNAMSHVFLEQTGGHESKEELYDRLWASIEEHGLDYERGRIEKAYEFACRAHEGQKRYSGDEYVTHPINVAILLTEMEGDEDTVVSGPVSYTHLDVYKRQPKGKENRAQKRVHRSCIGVRIPDGADEKSVKQGL